MLLVCAFFSFGLVLLSSFIGELKKWWMRSLEGITCVMQSITGVCLRVFQGSDAGHGTVFGDAGQSGSDTWCYQLSSCFILHCVW